VRPSEAFKRDKSGVGTYCSKSFEILSTVSKDIRLVRELLEMILGLFRLRLEILDASEEMLEETRVGDDLIGRMPHLKIARSVKAALIVSLSPAVSPAHYVSRRGKRGSLRLTWKRSCSFLVSNRIRCSSIRFSSASRELARARSSGLNVSIGTWMGSSSLTAGFSSYTKHQESRGHQSQLHWKQRERTGGELTLGSGFGGSGGGGTAAAAFCSTFCTL
jgi:hypothetical protein